MLELYSEFTDAFRSCDLICPLFNKLNCDFVAKKKKKKAVYVI